MRSQRVLPAALLALAGIFGCGEANVPQDGGEATATVTEAGIKRRPVSAFPKVGEYLPPLDDAKVELAPPAGWITLSRDSRYLSRFAKAKASELPRISVMAGDTPDAAVTDLTEENCDHLAALLLKQMKSEKKHIEEETMPIYLGDTLFIRHVRRAQLSGDPVVLQSLQTVKGGRLYTIELTCNIDAPRAEEYEASLKQYRDFGYSVAANMRFLGDMPAAAPAEPPAAAPSEENAKP
jgi:hypothetical protein